MVKDKFKWIIFSVTVIVIILILFGIWWWYWQAPYRTLSNFLEALYKGDVDIIYNLSLDKEKELGLTLDTIKRIYQQCLKPVLEHHRLISVERGNKSLIIYEASIPFYLWFEDLNHPVVVGVVRWPGTKNWKISFSAFSMSIVKSLLIKDDYQSYKFFKDLGLRFWVSSLGSIEDIEVLMLLTKLQRFHRVK